MEHWKRVPEWADKPPRGWDDDLIKHHQLWFLRRHPRPFTAKRGDGYVNIQPDQVRCVATQRYHDCVGGDPDGPINYSEIQSLLIQGVHALVLIESYDKAIDNRHYSMGSDGWLIPQSYNLQKHEIETWWKTHFDSSPSDIASLCFPGKFGGDDAVDEAMRTLQTSRQRALFQGLLTFSQSASFEDLRNLNDAWDDGHAVSDHGINKQLKNVRAQLRKSQWWFEVSEAKYQFTWIKRPKI